jgi:hypothetical protein
VRNIDDVMHRIESPIDRLAKELTEELFNTIHNRLAGIRGAETFLRDDPDWHTIYQPALAERTMRYLSIRLSEQATGWNALVGKALEERRDV